MAELIKMFLSGIALGNGPCLVTCVPLVLPYILGLPRPDDGSKAWKHSLKITVLFSFSRLLAYSVLGFLVVAFYRFVFGTLGENGVHLQLLLGVLVIFYGVLFLLGVSQRLVSHPLCASFYAKTTGKSTIQIIVFGLLIGFTPCGSLLSALTYIAAMVESPFEGLLAGFAFGSGTLLTLLVPLGLMAGLAVDVTRKFPRFFKAARFLGSLVLIYFGGSLVMRWVFFVF